MLGTNAGLIGAARTSRRGAAVGLWTPNEQVVYQRQNAWIGDASYDSVSLLLHMDGSNGSTTFTDSSKNALTVTANNGAAISTTQAKFGNASGYFPSTANPIEYLSVPATSALNLESQNFTIEFWHYLLTQTDCTLIAQGDYTTNNVNTSYVVQYAQSNASRRLEFMYSTNGTAVAFLSSGYLLTPATWNHLSFVRNGSAFSIYVNGTSVYNGTMSGSIFSSTRELMIGGWRVSYNGGTNFEGAQGYIDDLRITKGVARYTTNFTAPTAPFPDA